MTLVILAAGMGSRYGGLKQIDPITDHGEFIIDFSVFDAVRSGFDKVVFVIKKENLEEFRATIGKRFESKVKVEYAFQDINDIPAGFSVPEGRTKPWGTAQALLAARSVVKEPFAVINADDFYGKSAYSLLASHFSHEENSKKAAYCMVGYVLENTLTENGTVSRGICEVGEDGYLRDVTERTAISKEGDSAVYEENGEKTKIALDAIASMNCWGFTPDIFEGVMEGFKTFLSDLGNNPLKCEYYLPFAVRELMAAGKCTVKVYSSKDAWYGVTYHEDKEKVKNSIRTLTQSGVYPDGLNR
ncbi:MAG: nucleotidyltransferase [Ruminococcaceae bacterium]|nr:nucleotidyltransferase [Oscillospiraceae bacterium]